MKFAFIIGARPQFIKLSPLCRALDAHNRSSKGNGITSVIIHTGQHYDYELSKIFFDQLLIPLPKYNLEVGSASHGKQTGIMMERIEDALLEETPDVAVVFGDTNSTLAGALVASKLHIPVAHVEAGLRSFNKKMPEEINRLVADHVSTLLFCPTDRAVLNLRREGFANTVDNFRPSDSLMEVLKTTSASNPLVVKAGDIMYDAFVYNEALAASTSTILKDLSLSPRQYALLTIHRAENTDDSASLERIIAFLEKEDLRSPMIFPVHPRTRKLIDEKRIAFPSSVSMVPPVSYFDMLILERNSAIIYTDSGGVQKEAFFMRVPCVTLREETEWTETLESGWNRLMGDSRDKARKASSASQLDQYLFGDGHAADRHFQILMAFCRSRISEEKQSL
ncbi:MAG: UDP-N-acetyl glucosamine 2-epimerase [Bacteroidota bacterium]